MRCKHGLKEGQCSLCAGMPSGVTNIGEGPPDWYITYDHPPDKVSEALRDGLDMAYLAHKYERDIDIDKYEEDIYWVPADPAAVAKNGFTTSPTIALYNVRHTQA